MIPCALTIAGSDSGGGAGVQADLKTFAALGVHGLSAFTALTAQSTVEVRAVHAVPAAFVRAQVATVLDDFEVGAVKTGMIGSVDVAHVLAELIAERGLQPVVDPVMIASSGASLMDEDTLQVVVRSLFPRACLVTPNLPEVGRLTGHVPNSESEMVAAGERILSLGARAVLVKGGHASFAPVDILVAQKASGEIRVTRFPGERIATTSTHGTGCTYAAAIAAFLAKGNALEASIERAHTYLLGAIRAAPTRPTLGKGTGPVHHFHAFYPWGAA